MSFTETILLGALAGFTIYLGLPLARLRLLGDGARVALAMFAVGVLAFLFVDVMSHAEEILEDAVKGFSDGKEGLGQPALYGALLAVGFAAGTAGLALLERRMRPRGRTSPPMAGGESASVVSSAESGALSFEADAARRRALQT